MTSAPTPLESAFSAQRLRGEPLPEDLRVLLLHRDELAGQLGLQMREEPGWAPSRAHGTPRRADWANADAAADAQAIAQVCERIAFALASEHGECYGYWRGEDGRGGIDTAPLVKLGKERRFQVCAGRTLAETLLFEFSYGDVVRFGELRDWLDALGLKNLPVIEGDIAWPTVIPSPAQLHGALFERLRHARA